MEEVTYSDSGLLEVESEGERLPHEDVRVVTGEEGSLQLLQLPRVEVGPRSPPLAREVLLTSAQVAIWNREAILPQL